MEQSWNQHKKPVLLCYVTSFYQLTLTWPQLTFWAVLPKSPHRGDTWEKIRRVRSVFCLISSYIQLTHSPVHIYAPHGEKCLFRFNGSVSFVVFFCQRGETDTN